MSTDRITLEKQKIQLTSLLTTHHNRCCYPLKFGNVTTPKNPLKAK